MLQLVAVISIFEEYNIRHTNEKRLANKSKQSVEKQMTSKSNFSIYCRKKIKLKL